MTADDRVCLGSRIVWRIVEMRSVERGIAGRSNVPRCGWRAAVPARALERVGVR